MDSSIAKSAIKVPRKNQKRTRVLRVKTEHVSIQSIVEPILKAASSILETKIPSKLGSYESIRDVLLESKIELAKVMGYATQDTYKPEELSNLVAIVSINDGHCKVTLDYRRNGVDEVTESYIIHFRPSMDKDLYQAMMVRHKEIHPTDLKALLAKL